MIDVVGSLELDSEPAAVAGFPPDESDKVDDVLSDVVPKEIPGPDEEPEGDESGQ